MATVNATLRYISISGLLGIAGYAIATTTILLTDGPNQPTFKLDVSSAIDEPASYLLATHEEIKNWEIFGPHSSDSSDLKSEKKVVNSKLNLSLLGTFYISEGGGGWAIIGGEDKTATLVKLGERLEDSHIAQILPDRVILERNGQLERLMLTAFEDLNEPASASLTKKTMRQPHQESPSEPHTARERIIRRNGLRPVSPVKAAGYLVTEKATRLQDKYGLQTGDIVVSVNGYPIGAALEDEMAYESFKQTGTAQFSIQRDGAVLTMKYQQ